MNNWKATAYHVSDDDGKLQGSLEFEFQTHSERLEGKKPYNLARRLYALRQNAEGFSISIKQVGIMELELA